MNDNELANELTNILATLTVDGVPVDTPMVITIPPAYTVRIGFVKTRIVRNLSLLKDLFADIIKQDGFVCGGFARLCLSANTAPVVSGDIDIYCKSLENYDKILERLNKRGFYETRSSEAANTMEYSYKGMPTVQLIKPFNEGRLLMGSDTVEDILSNFDFTIARAAITYESIQHHEGIVDIDFIEDDALNRLIIKNIHCPISAVYRLSKYMNKGYKCEIKTIIQVLDDWRTRPDSYKIQILQTLEKEEPSEDEIRHLEALLHID